MRKRRLANILTAIVLGTMPVALVVSACSKPEPPPPGPLASDEDDKKKTKKKKSTDDEDPKPIGDPTDPTSGSGTAALPKIVGPIGDGGAKSKSDSDKAKLMACCTALRNAATAAGVAGAAGSAVVPGLPPPPPKAELDKQVAECDKQVANWSGDLNSSLGKVKGASPVALPSACAITGG